MTTTDRDRMAEAHARIVRGFTPTNQDACSDFKTGWDACEKQMREKIEKLERIYISAVNGRKEFRKVFMKERAKLKLAVDAMNEANQAMNLYKVGMVLREALAEIENEDK